MPSTAVLSSLSIDSLDEETISAHLYNPSTNSFLSLLLLVSIQHRRLYCRWLLRTCLRLTASATSNNLRQRSPRMIGQFHSSKPVGKPTFIGVIIALVSAGDVLCTTVSCFYVFFLFTFMSNLVVLLCRNSDPICAFLDSCVVC